MRVLGDIDLDPFLLDRVERLGDVAAPGRVGEIGGERVVVELDDQRMRVAVIRITAVSSRA